MGLIADCHLRHSMDDWELLAENGNTSKSKLERTLGQGADSAHVALKAGYRKRYEGFRRFTAFSDHSLFAYRPGDSLDLGRNSQEEITESAVVPLLKAIPASIKSMIEGPSTSTTTLTRPNLPTVSSETSAKLVGSGSFSAVLQAGRKRLQHKEQDGSVLRKGRSSSPEKPDALPVAQFENEERGEMTDDELKVVNDLDPAERKILLKRTRKLERVLGETLKEREIGRHVVQCHAEKCASADADELEIGHRTGVSLDATSQSTFDRSQPEIELQRLSLESARAMVLSPLDQIVNDRDSSNAETSKDDILEASPEDDITAGGTSSPRAVVKTRARRYSSPTSPGNDAWHDDDDILGDLAGPNYFPRELSSVKRERRQRRIQMIKVSDHSLTLGHSC